MLSFIILTFTFSHNATDLTTTSYAVFSKRLISFKPLRKYLRFHYTTVFRNWWNALLIFIFSLKKEKNCWKKFLHKFWMFYFYLRLHKASLWGKVNQDFSQLHFNCFLSGFILSHIYSTAAVTQSSNYTNSTVKPCMRLTGLI